MPHLDIIALDPAISVIDGREEVRRQIHEVPADCLIVDTFPRGLGGELAELLPTFPGSKVLVQRDLNPQYAAAYHLNAFVSEHYDLVLTSEQTPTTQPWLVRSCHELMPRDAARQFLGLTQPKPCVIVCAAGNPDELAWYGDVSALLIASARCDVRCIAPTLPRDCPPEFFIPYWPAIDLYAAADIVIGGGGYNTVYECAACAVPLIARPWPRKYDRQNLRASRHGSIIVDEPQHAVAAAIELLQAIPSKSHQTEFRNGVHDAVAMIVASYRP
jgi:hypothetical protein